MRKPDLEAPVSGMSSKYGYTEDHVHVMIPVRPKALALLGNSTGALSYSALVTSAK